MRDINLIVVHCSATTPMQDIGVEDIRRWHLARGWRDVGYHKIIRRDGTIEDGRPEIQLGAHARGNNKNSLAVCMVGGVDEYGDPENNYDPIQWSSLRQVLVRWRTLYPETDILGHRDLSPDVNHDGVIDASEWIKACPCFDVKEWVKVNLNGDSKDG